MHKKEGKLDLTKFLFHGLYYEELNPSNLNIYLQKLVDIIRAGGILSRQKVKELYGEDYFEILGNNLIDLNWNGEEFVSICKFLTDDKDATYHSEAYRLFCSKGITLIIDKSILNSSEIDNFGRFEDGEIRIKDKIDLSYMKGILINTMNPSTIIKHYIKRGISSEEIKNSMECLYNEGINQVFEILNQYKINLPLYSSVNARIIKPFKVILEEISSGYAGDKEHNIKTY